MPAIEPDNPLPDDVPCMRCGYNLRTKRPSESCPECGQPVGPSMVAHHKNRPLRDPRRAARGAWLLVFSTVSTGIWLGVSISSIQWRLGPTIIDLLCDLFWPVEVLQIAAAVAAPVGIFLLTAGASRVPLPNAPAPRRRLGNLLIVLAPLAAVATKLATTVPLTGVRRWQWLNTILPPLAITATAAGAVLCIVGGVLLIGLAGRQRWKIFATVTAFVFLVAVLIQIAAASTVAIWWHIFPGWGFGSPLFNLFQSLRIAIDVGGPLLTLALAFYFTSLALHLRKLNLGAGESIPS